MKTALFALVLIAAPMLNSQTPEQYKEYHRYGLAQGILNGTFAQDEVKSCVRQGWPDTSFCSATARKALFIQHKMWTEE